MMYDDDAATTSSSDRIIHDKSFMEFRGKQADTSYWPYCRRRNLYLGPSQIDIYMNEMDPFWLHNSIIAYDPVSVVKFDTFLEVLVVGTNGWIRVLE